MFWQCGDVASMCLWDDPVAILGSSFWTKRGNSGRDQGSQGCMFIFGKEGTPYVGFLSMEIYEIHPASLPPFSCKRQHWTSLPESVSVFSPSVQVVDNHCCICGWKLWEVNSGQGQMSELKNIKRWNRWLGRVQKRVHSTSFTMIKGLS